MDVVFFTSFWVLPTATAASIGFIHALTGPDHYLPFVALARAGGWSMRKTVEITVISGIAHVASAVLIGAIGLGLGTASQEMGLMHTHQASVAAWTLVVFGAIYMAWGVYRLFKPRGTFVYIASKSVGPVSMPRTTRSRPHRHGWFGMHVHAHTGAHTHSPQQQRAMKMAPWVVFAVFVLGPCEPLLPLMLLPTLQGSLVGMVWIIGVFSIVSIVTMVGMVVLLVQTSSVLPSAKLERLGPALVGCSLFVCGAGMLWLGW